MPETRQSEINWRAIVTWRGGALQAVPCRSEHEARDQVARWKRMNPGDVEDAGVERRVSAWERV